MKNGKCPTCSSNDIYKFPYTNAHRDSQFVSGFSKVKLEEYVCGDCGLIETYLADMGDVEKIKTKCTKVEVAD